MFDHLAFLTRIRYASDRKAELIILSGKELAKIIEKKRMPRKKVRDMKTIEKRKEKYTYR